MPTGGEDDSSMKLWTWKRENLPSQEPGVRQFSHFYAIFSDLFFLGVE
jgi:hypothetical protein